jgi:uncharacterized RmlC-like cupin family protein
MGGKDREDHPEETLKTPTPRADALMQEGPRVVVPNVSGGVSMKSIGSRFIIVLAVGTMLGSVATAAPAFARHHHHTKLVSAGSGLSLVLVNSGDAQANWGEKVTFDVSTNATDYPFVGLNCYKNTTLVLSGSAGFFPSYPWPATQDFTLRSNVWTAGAADCTATLYSVDGGKETVLGTLDFHVNA